MLHSPNQQIYRKNVIFALLTKRLCGPDEKVSGPDFVRVL